MKAVLEIPRAMVAYSKWHSVDPRDVAQFVLDEHGRECADLMLELESGTHDAEEALWLN